ncbi:MAG: trehalose/maltose hydrolase-like predicted phosphorylase [Cyclobacteriaceae bacterium]|jgi:trehalose/maltose hydrolase-like predicted phosphorylase
MYKQILIAFILVLSTRSAIGQNDAWVIRTSEINPDKYFGVTVANGVTGLVSSPIPFQVKDVVLNGAFDRYGRGRVSNIMKVFNTANIEFTNPYFTEEGKNAYDEMFSEIIEREQSINMRYGEFTDKVSYQALDVTYTLRSLRHLPFTSMVTVTITAKQAIELAPAAVLKAPEILRDVQQYYAVVDIPGHEQIPLMTSTASSPTGKLVVAGSSSIHIEGEGHTELIHEERNYEDHRLKMYRKLQKGESLTFHTYGTVCTSAHFADPQNEAERLTLYAFLEGAERNIARHRAAWETLWASGDIEITGDAAITKDIRFALYHLYSFARAGTSYSMSPMGLSGLGYNGHVFWDTELWMYPPLLMLQPAIAKSLLEYRFERLQAAKQNAFSHGYKGAMFPWESDQDGQEATPIWALTGPFEHHISGDIGWAFWKYYQVTKDKEWLASRGYPVLKEVADFWVSRTDLNDDGSLSIRNVVGADEYAEGVDDNAFTNGVAKVALGYAAEAARELGLIADPNWEETAGRIRLLTFDDGVTREHASYDGEIIKQADVNLLSYPLDLIRNPDAIKRDIDYYENRYDKGGPAMGFAILSILYNWTGDQDKSYSYFKQGYQPNKVPPFGVISEMSGGSNPYFATGAGGMLQNVLAGFGGIEITDEGIKQTVKTILPKGWKKLIITGAGIEEKTIVIE